MATVQVIDNRGKALADVQGVGWPRTPHRLALGMSCDERDDHEPLVRRCRVALRGKRVKVLVVDNYGVSAFCGINE